MGSNFARPVAAAPITTPTTLTIRNLTVTHLELKLVERLDHEHLLSKVSSRIPGRRRPHEVAGSGEQQEEQRPASSAGQEVGDLTITPFSECPTPIYVPNPARHHEQLRLTFEDPSTGHRYSAEIPGLSHRSIVLQASKSSSPDEPKEFTAIYLPAHAYLALFSSANLSSWMSTLPSHLPLSALSIPGTHNSPTHYMALPSVRCQAVPVLDQLENGVRFLDVRVSCPVYTPPPRPPPPSSSGARGHDDDADDPPALRLVHSAFPITINPVAAYCSAKTTLASLLATVRAFLAAHPTETVLLSIKREGTGRGTDADLSQILLRHYIERRPTTPAPDPDSNSGSQAPAEEERWYTSDAIPTLAECRGKIVLVRRFGLHGSIAASGRPLGIDGSAWPDNVADGMCGAGTIRIQDYYGIAHSGEIMERKARYVQEGLERAAQAVHNHPRNGLPVGGGGGTPGMQSASPDDGDGQGQPPPPPLYINFLSASSFFNVNCWPDRIAVKLNPAIVEYLCMGHGAPGKGPGQLSIGDAATGIVVTDWVGHNGDWDLIRCVVGWNARLKLRQ